MTLFPDISFWQGKPDFDVMKSQTDYVILRGGQGKYADTEFENNRKGCERVGLKWGMYWFYDDRYDPAIQAAKLSSLFPGDAPRPAEIFTDWEVFYNGDFGGLKNVVAFMERVQQLMPWAVQGMYTGFYWFTSHSNPVSHQSQYKYLKDKPLWLAWYTNDHTPTGVEHVRIPAPWTEMTYWQFGTPALGKQYGVESVEIDMNMRMGESPTPRGSKMIMDGTLFTEQT